MIEDREPNDKMTEDNYLDEKPGDNYIQESASEQPAPEPIEASTEDMTRVGIVTGEKRMNMSAPVKEFEEFKDSFKAMMVAFGNLIEAAGMEIGKDETSEKISELSGEVEKLRQELMDEEERNSERLLSRAEFESFKIDNDEKTLQASEDYVRRSEFDRFRAAIRDVL